MTVEAGSLNLNDWVFLGQSLYSVACKGTSGPVTFSHECPDGLVKLAVLEEHDDVETAGERLMDLQGRKADIAEALERATERFGRQCCNPTRRQMAHREMRDLRAERAAVEAQIDELVALGVAAELHLGTDPRHDEELRAEAS